jgi:Lrp/AsnC family leucine-responsive transcriptional regulator
MAFDSKAIELDGRDWALLAALQENARLSFANLARRVRLTPPAVAERVRRLEDKGVITGYHAAVSLPATGRTLQVYFRVFVPPRDYPRFLRTVEKLPEVLECCHVTGAESFMVKAAVASVQHLEQLIKKMTAFGETTTSVVLSTNIARKAVGQHTGEGS